MLGSGDTIATRGSLATPTPSFASLTGPCSVHARGSTGVEGTGGGSAGRVAPRAWMPSPSSAPALPR